MAKIVKQSHGGALNQQEKGDPALPNAGRPRRTLRVILDEWTAQGHVRVSKEDVAHGYESMIDLSEDELRSVQADKKISMFVRIVAKELLKERGFATIEIMLDRAHGKAATPLKLEGVDVFANVPDSVKKTLKKYESPILSSDVSRVVEGFSGDRKSKRRRSKKVDQEITTPEN